MANHEADESTNSIEDDWKYLDQAIRLENESADSMALDDQEIPVESALDEVDAYVDDSYNDILNDKINQSLNETAITGVNRGEVMDEIEVDMKDNTINYEGELLNEFEDSKGELHSDILEGELDQMDVLNSILTDEEMNLDQMLEEELETDEFDEILKNDVTEAFMGNLSESVEEVSEDAELDLTQTLVGGLGDLEESRVEEPSVEPVDEVEELVSEEPVEELVEVPVEEIEESLFEEPVSEMEESIPEVKEEAVEDIEEIFADEPVTELEEILSDDVLEEVDEELTEEISEGLLEEIEEELLEEAENDLPEELVEEVNEELPEEVFEEAMDQGTADLLKEIDDVLPSEFMNTEEDDLAIAEMMQDVESAEESTMSLEEFDALLGDLSNEEPEDIGKMTTASDIFSESLGAVSSLEDQELEETFNSLLPDMEDTKEQAPPKTLMQKMFANIEPENPEEEIAAAKEAFEKKEEDKKLKAEEKEKKKEEKKKAAEEKKAAKAAEKEAKAKAKADKKAELLAQKQKEKEEFEKNYVPEGKINKVGASIVFGTAAAIGVMIVLGSFKGSHSLTVDTAEFNTQIGRYKQAYESLNGLDLSVTDQILYDKVSTVMVVQKQQKSYENFTELKMHVEALDSLLKGLERCDEYYDRAKKFDVTSQYDKLRSGFLSELTKTYGVSEMDAKALIAEKDPTAYTKALSQICSNKVSQ